MKKHIFRTAAVTAALAGISLLASCGSGLLDTEDESFTSNVLSISADVNTLECNYGMAGDPVTLTVTLNNGEFSDSLKNAAVGDDITDFFDVKLVDKSDTIYPYLRDYTLTLSEAVTGGKTSLYDLNDGTAAVLPASAYIDSQYTLKAILNYKLTSDHSDATSGSVQISATAEALASGVSQRGALSLSYSFDTGTYAVLAPTMTLLTTARTFIDSGTVTALSSGLAAAARLSLPIPTATAIDAGTQIATATVGNLDDVKVYTATDVVEEAGVIPVIFHSASATAERFSGTISNFALNTQFVGAANAAAVAADQLTEADATVLPVPYFGQDYELVTDYSSVAKSSTDNGNGGFAEIATSDNATYSKYLYIYNSGAGGTRGGWTTETLNAPSAKPYIMEFDAGISPSYYANATPTVGFEVTTSTPTGAASVANYLLNFTITKNSSSSTSTGVSHDWTTNAATTTTAGLTEATFYHYKLEFDGSSTVTLTLSDSTGSKLIDGEALTIGGSSYAATNLHIYFERGYHACLMLDNVQIYYPGVATAE